MQIDNVCNFSVDHNATEKEDKMLNFREHLMKTNTIK